MHAADCVKQTLIVYLEFFIKGELNQGLEGLEGGLQGLEGGLQGLEGGFKGLLGELKGGA